MDITLFSAERLKTRTPTDEGVGLAFPYDSILMSAWVPRSVEAL